MATQATKQGLGRRILLATAIAGTLDIGWAALVTVVFGNPVGGMLRDVASGPFPGAPGWGMAGAIVGLLVHYAIMAVMAALFMIAADRIGWVRRTPVAAGLVYGFGLWLVMSGLVVHMRFGAPFPPANPVAIARQLFAHVVLVGLTFGLIARRGPA